jgi:lipid A ethanolaminephosphotransferase
MNISLWKFVAEKIAIGSFIDVIFTMTLPIFVFAAMVLIFALLFLPYLGKFITIAFLLISAYASHAMFYYGVFIDQEMVQNVFETNPREAVELITLTLILWCLILGVVPSILLFAVKVKFASVKREIILRVVMIFAALLTVGLIAAIVYKEYASFGRNNKQVTRLINPTNFVEGTIKYARNLYLSQKEFEILDPAPKYAPKDATRLKVFVIVIGETARAANFSLGGYTKETNPLLARQNGLIYFNNVKSCGTSTGVSVPCIFSNLPRKEFKTGDFYYRENLMDIISKSGYKTLWLENDDGCKGVCDRIENYEMIHTNAAKDHCDDRYCFDSILLDGLEDLIVKTNENLVLVLHAIGSHGPTYFRRYPSEFKKFTPICETAELQNCSTEQIINVYDNTILYTDFILSETIDILRKFGDRKTGLLFVSDHGENLGENGIYLHGFPYMIAPKEQIEVPMLLWLNENMIKLNKINYECLARNAKSKEYSHDNLFSSFSSLLNISTTLYDPELDIFAPCRVK